MRVIGAHEDWRLGSRSEGVCWKARPCPYFTMTALTPDSTTRCYRSTFIGNSVGGSDAFARGGAIYCTNTQSILTRFNVGRRVLPEEKNV